MPYYGSGANLTGIDLTGLIEDAAVLGFKVATNGSLAKYNLVDQTEDVFTDESGIDTGASTNAYHNTSKYMVGQLGVTTAFSYTGANQTFSVGAGITAINVKAWGAGGGDRLGGSGGGFATSTGATVSASTTLMVVVGGGGTGAATSGGFGGGGNAGPNGINSSGGGMSGVFSANTFAQGNAILIAGGGGGGGQGGQGYGGGGGGATGSDNRPAGNQAGAGGSQTGGGQGGHAGRSGGQSGSALQGGSGGGYGSGGGGGYYGGGGGGDNAGQHGGGGGGSGYIASGSSQTNTAGGNGPGGVGAGQSDAQYPGGGVGNGSNPGAGNGAVWIQSEAPADMTLISNSTTAEAVPTKATIVMTYNNGTGTATINTDLKAYASRDNGTTYTQFTLADQGDTGGHTILSTHDLDISGQPSGTSMRYKVTTHNQSASLRTNIQAMSLGWS